MQASTLDEHICRLKKLFQRLADFGFRVRLDKCAFLETQVEYFGELIDKDGRRPDPMKTAAVKDMPVPTSASYTRS